MESSQLGSWDHLFCKLSLNKKRAALMFYSCAAIVITIINSYDVQIKEDEKEVKKST